MLPYHKCSEECFCQVLNESLLEQLEIERPYEEDRPHRLDEVHQTDPELAARMDEWWDELSELGGEA